MTEEEKQILLDMKREEQIIYDMKRAAFVLCALIYVFEKWMSV